MSSTKTILVLANSIKHDPCTCIAGREIRSRGDYYVMEPGWVRPISDHDEGGIYPGEAELNTGQIPQVGDFVEIPLLKHVNDRCQPENWLIAPTGKWREVNKSYQKPDLKRLVEFPENLWLQPNEKSDRVKSQWIERNLPSQSLYLIHLQSIQVQFGWRPWQGEYKPRKRAQFTYQGSHYDMAITDPTFLAKYRNQIPDKGERASEFQLRSTNGYYICVSLAPEFNGFHFKVIATIIEDWNVK